MKLMQRLLTVFVTGVLFAGPGRPLPATQPALAQLGDPVFVGAGDITNCRRDQDESTADLLASIDGTVFTLGDNAYPDGAPVQFDTCYDPGWGRFKDRTMPAPGNHDYHTSGAAGYYGYFGETASPLDNNCTRDCKGYYSYDLGGWHIIALNSETHINAGSEQEQWLRADLAAHPSACTLAYWHEPRFSSGRHGNNKRVGAFWDALYGHGADVVLNGHDHLYERFAPQDPKARADPNGIREFVVGTGGAELYEFPDVQPNSEVRDNTSWGVLKLTLHATSYDWEFIPVPGGTFTDSGSADCVNGENVQPGNTGTATLVAPRATSTGTDTPVPTATEIPAETPTLAAPPAAPPPAACQSISCIIARWWAQLVARFK